MTKAKLDPASDVLYRIKRGLSGYVSYLAACEMNEAFSEYILYEPALRILTAFGLTVQSEAKCPGYERAPAGDVKKLDFVAHGNGVHFALEMKWARNRHPRIEGDLEKLAKYRQANASSLGFLCIFGVRSCLSAVPMPEGCSERGAAIYAEFGKTRYGCRVYELVDC